ncbi:LCP2 [Symbiodinium natans]|uniref:LCP2 protein n=1 Tax=Symbiodinium natans TaxID=878477 RepID=A0A812UKZ1_9DINO|nr:LCP2 [Symbiodinium natans]
MDSLLANIQVERVRWHTRARIGCVERTILMQARFHLPAECEEVAEFVATGHVKSREPVREEAPRLPELEWVWALGGADLVSLHGRGEEEEREEERRGNEEVADFSHMPPAAGQDMEVEAVCCRTRAYEAVTDKVVAETTQLDSTFGVPVSAVADERRGEAVCTDSTAPIRTATITAALEIAFPRLLRASQCAGMAFFNHPTGAHVPQTGELDCEGPIARSQTRRPRLKDKAAPLPPALGGAGSCIHLNAALCQHDDFSLFEAVEKDIEAASYQRPGDALGFHRSRKHLQIWGDALSGSQAFASVITRALAMFDLTLVDCWANLYRSEDDFKSWHHDNYQDWTPRPTATIGLSLGQARALAFQDARTKGEHHVLQQNGDIFAFDEPFNNFFKHSVPAAKSPAGAVCGKRISIILFVNEQEHVPRTLRVKMPGMRDSIPLSVCWDAWDTCGCGSLCRRARRLSEEIEIDEPSLKQLLPLFDQLAKAQTFYHVKKPVCQSANMADDIRMTRGPPLGDTGPGEPDHRTDGEGLKPCQPARSFYTMPRRSEGHSTGKAADPGMFTTFIPSTHEPANTHHFTAYRAPAVPMAPTSPTPAPTTAARLSEATSPSNFPAPRAREDPELLAARQALTLQGAQQVLAILRGRKLIENRAWRIPQGWYAIHAGAQHINEDRAARIRAVWPDAPPEECHGESLPHGAILGLFYVHSHTTPQGCLPGYVWARGPICHVISKSVELLRPVHCRGGKGLWDLEVWQVQQIQQQFTEINIRVHDLTEVLPRGSCVSQASA